MATYWQRSGSSTLRRITRALVVGFIVGIVAGAVLETLTEDEEGES